jgi:hypothetical protein
MNKNVSLRQDVAVDGAKPEVKVQRAAYLAQLPASKQALHRWMNGLTIASTAVPIGFLVRALVLSIAGRQIAGGQIGAPAIDASTPSEEIRIAVAWLVFITSVTIPLMFIGLHAVLLRAFPPNNVLSTSKFVTGRDAVGNGVGMMGTLLVAGAFWGFVAYIVWTSNVAILEPVMRIMGALIGVGIAVAVVWKLLQQIRRAQ